MASAAKEGRGLEIPLKCQGALALFLLIFWGGKLPRAFRPGIEMTPKMSRALALFLLIIGGQVAPCL